MDGVSSNLSTDILLNQLSPLKATGGKSSAKPEESGVGGVLNQFGDMLKQQMAEINNLQAQADDAIQTYAVGGPIELHNVILATEKAGTAMQLAVQVRNKLLSAYQELNRMQV